MNSKFQYGMDKILYYVCMCWWFGHRWKHVGDFPPNTLHEDEKIHFHGGYRCSKCELCNLVVKEHLIYQIIDGELV